MRGIQQFAAACVASLVIHAEAAKTSVTNKPSIPEVSLVGSNLCEVALAVVDGVPVTGADAKEAVLVGSTIADLSKWGKVVKRPAGKQANLAAMRIVPRLISSRVLEAELDRRGIVATTNSDAIVLAEYNKRLDRNAKTTDELSALFGELASAFKKQFARESRYQALFAHEAVRDVTDREISRFYRNLTNRYEKCCAINAAASNKIEKAWKELAAGSSWEGVATNCTEDALLDESLADNWQHWQTLKINKIEPMDLMIAISKLKPGEFTKPMETVEGLTIVKLLERDGDVCTLARILVRLAVKVKFPDRETAIRKIRSENIVAFQRELLPTLRAKAKIEYPFGKKFKFKIWDETKSDSARRAGRR